MPTIYVGGRGPYTQVPTLLVIIPHTWSVPNDLARPGGSCRGCHIRASVEGGQIEDDGCGGDGCNGGAQEVEGTKEVVRSKRLEREIVVV